MNLARFSYDVHPVDREREVGFIRREVEAAQANGFRARLLVPLTRPQDGAALHFEIELQALDQLETFRQGGVGSPQETGDWIHAFSEILLSPPAVEIYRVDPAGGTEKRS